MPPRSGSVSWWSGTIIGWQNRPFLRYLISRMLNRFGERNFRYLLAIQRADNMGQAEEFRGRQKEIDRIEAMLDRELEKGSCFSLKQLAVNGNDLLGLGLSGPAVLPVAAARAIGPGHGRNTAQ